MTAGPPIAIRAEQLVKRFGDVTALGGVSFEVPVGRVLGLLGPNGAGKTTSVRILTTLLRPDGGHAEVLGIDVTADPHRVRGSIGLAGQAATVDENLTARENLKMVGRLTHMASAEIGRRGGDLLERFALADDADRVVRTFSGGMRRRLDLAAALMHQPPVLFLDEPTTGLDPQGRTELWAVIEDLVDTGVTVLLTTQYLEEADYLADYIVVVDHGRVIAEGTASELKTQLGSTVIEVALRDAADAPVAQERLGAIGPVAVDGKVLHISLPDGDGATAMLETVRALDDAKLEPATLALREPTLDDVFLELTGHVAEDPSANGDAAPAAGRRRRRRGA
ncbi:MAG TPA: ATP-binding cassette domain-containing protein [Acidimicrobiia bacterium]|nr:ATP-binding cassette domain-containing protein [Acidimicrobiia bacterium]